MRFAERVLKMKKLSELIPEGIRSCAIAGHLNPDGDCVGSVTAVWQYIRKYRPEIEVALFLERPADELMFLPGMEEILSETPETERKDLFISCDASSVDRIGVAENLFHAERSRIPSLPASFTTAGCSSIPTRDPRRSGQQPALWKRRRPARRSSTRALT